MLVSWSGVFLLARRLQSIFNTVNNIVRNLHLFPLLHSICRIYPAEAYEIFSFEIDPTLRPYFAGLTSPRHHLFCPSAVVGNVGSKGNALNFTTAYLQTPWTPKDKLQDGKEMHWGEMIQFVDAITLSTILKGAE